MRLRRAQAAILNPDKDSDDFLNKTEQELRDIRSRLKFSKNSVCIDIKDPDATVLSFVDLPGERYSFWDIPPIFSDVTHPFRPDPK